MTRRQCFAVFAAVAVVVLGGAAWIDSQIAVDSVDRLGWIKERVRRQFPDAPQISTEELAGRLAAGERLVLLDVRRDEEFAVSHLAGAIRVDPDADRPALPAGVEAGQTVVAYCSVGWRSSKWVEALRAEGVEAVNLEGSIFQWVAEDRPLVRPDGRATEVVHPYGRAWAWLVDPDDRAYE